MTKKTFLDSVYNLKSVEDTRSLYNEWAQSYDDEVSGEGYITPDRIAEITAGLLDENTSPILDFGCGTGMSGEALARAGLSHIDGCDMSEGMLEQARSKQVYNHLWLSDPATDFPVEPGKYRAIIACGVISIGAAPPETMDMLMTALAPGDFLVFSFNDHTLVEPRFEAQVKHHIDSGHAKLVLRQDGEHLPGLGMRSTIFALQRK